MTKANKIGFVYKVNAFKCVDVFAQVIAWDEKMGYLMRISALALHERLPTYDDLKTGALFAPVFVGLEAAVRAKEWILVAKLAINQEAIPLFKATNQSPPDLSDASWYIKDGGKSKFVGVLSLEQKKLETYQIWGYKILEDRIRESVGQ